MKNIIKILTIFSLVSASSLASGNYIMKFSNSQSIGLIPDAPDKTAFSSCKDILDNGESTGNGVYSITVNNKEFNVYCDMTSVGGGWTMVAAQFEQDPVINWNEGVQADYDPSLSTNKGFALNSQEIPNHAQTAFGRDFDADYVDYINYLYTTSDLQKELVSGLKSNQSYHVHRNKNVGYSYCNPENGYASAPWLNALTLDRTSVNGFDWCFFPEAGSNINYDVRGYSMSGQSLYSQNNDFAWTVWVR